MIVVVPIALPSLANLRGHWSHKARIVKQTRLAVGMYLGGGPRPALPCVVTITRVAPRMLDDDNLSGSAKGARDEVARWLGIDDRDPRVSWRYDQRTAKVASVEIRIESVG